MHCASLQKFPPGTTEPADPPLYTLPAEITTGSGEPASRTSLPESSTFYRPLAAGKPAPARLPPSQPQTQINPTAD